MSETTTIQWTDRTWSPWQGCSKVGPGCDHCYAEALLDKRLHRVEWGPGKARKLTIDWGKPLRWEREAVATGRTIKVFPSICDPFDNEVDPEWRAAFFQLIRDTPHLTWLLLTKRIGNAAKMLDEARRNDGVTRIQDFRVTPLHNIWLGATICNQLEADRDIPKLLAVPAEKRFVSVEPMLGPIDLYLDKVRNPDGSTSTNGKMAQALGTLPPRWMLLDWVIAGGESGPQARPAHPDWFRSLRDQCAAAGVPFLFKQWGEFSYEYDRDRDDPDYRRCSDWDHKPGRWLNLAGGHGFHGDRVHYAHKVGTKAAGNHLDGRQHLEFPA